MHADEHFKELVRRLRVSGLADEAALVSFYEDAFELVAAWGEWHWSLPRDDAQDLAQQACLRALRALPAYDLSQAFKPWLKTIAYRLFVDAHRRRRWLAPEVASELLADARSADALWLAERRADLAALRSRLSPADQDLLDRLVAFDGDVAKTASSLRVSPARIYQRLARLRSQAGR